MDNTTRFNHRARDYARYRQSYPPEVIDLIVREFIEDRDPVIADIGSGTGHFLRLIADNVSTIYGVEPNKDMREMAESSLICHPSFRSVPGSAESTTLPDRSVDLITAAQSFHWFDRERARIEFKRILRPGGRVLIVFYTRVIRSDLAREFDRILKDYGNDYEKVDHRNITMDVIMTFFGGPVEKRSFPSVQRMDRDLFFGRLRSVSYLPLPGEEGHEILMENMNDLFQKYQKEGILDFDYVTDLYWGSL